MTSAYDPPREEGVWSSFGGVGRILTVARADWWNTDQSESTVQASEIKLKDEWLSSLPNAASLALAAATLFRALRPFGVGTACS